jgi:ubiquinone/menaquinone biosynthesis C-methylase UbiE
MSADLHSQIDPYDYYEAMQSGTKAEQMFHRARTKLVVEVADAAGKRLLDVGAGAGALAIPLAQAGAEVVAVELSHEHCVTLKDRAGELGLDIAVVRANAASLPFPDDQFDIVCVASVVHLIPYPGPLLREAERVCRPDGRIVVAGPWGKHPKSMTWVKTLLRGAPPETKTYRFDRKRLARLLVRSTFVSQKIDYPMGYLATTWVPSGKE